LHGKGGLGGTQEGREGNTKEKAKFTWREKLERPAILIKRRGKRHKPSFQKISC